MLQYKKKFLEKMGKTNRQRLESLRIQGKIKEEERNMSGHSKWHNIQAKKGKADATRGKIFTKLGRELLIEV